jgi:hypothetical protein
MKCQISQAFTKPRPQFSTPWFCSQPTPGGQTLPIRDAGARLCARSRRASGAALADTARASSLTGPELGPDVLAKTLLCVLPGYLLQVAIRGADAVAAIPDAVRELLPAAR